MASKIIVANKFDTPKNFIYKILEQKPEIIFTKNEADLLHFLEEGDSASLSSSAPIIILSDFLNIRNALSVTHPLTQLQGSNVTYRTITERLHTSLAVLHLDINNFKHFNEKYGFGSGDEVIKETAEVIKSTIKKYGNNDDLIGHICGDIFMVVTTPEKAEKICEMLCLNFDKKIIKFYNEEDRLNKKLTIKKKLFKKTQYPIMTISIVLVTNEEDLFTNIGQICQKIRHYNLLAKKQSSNKSNFVKAKSL